MAIRERPILVYFLVTGQRVFRDWPFYSVIVFYWLTVSAVAQLSDVGEYFSPFIYLEKWMRPITLAAACMLCIIGHASWRQTSPLRAFFAGIRRVLPPAKAASVLLFIALAIFHGIFTSMKNVANTLIEFRYDVQFADLDAALHFGDPWRLLPNWEPLTVFFQVQYLMGWLTLLAVMSFYATIYAPRAVRNQYIWTFLICWIVLGNLVAMATMSAGPAYYALVTGSGRFQPLMNYLAFSENWSFSSVAVQDKLWLKYLFDTTGMGSGISAFPSLHLSMATLWTLMAYRASIKWGRLMAGFTVLIQIASVHLGWHYAIDGYFSILATVAVWKLVGYFQERGSLVFKAMPVANFARGTN